MLGIIRRSNPPAKTAKYLAILVFAGLLLHVPFLNQAFHIDDVQYLDIAANAFHNPLFPLDMPTAFEGRRMDMWGHTHPPLNAYVIAGLLLLHGRQPSEIYLHGAYLLFPVLASIAFYFLARRFVSHPLAAALLLATNPTLMVNAHTLMTDVPLLALWLSAAAMFIGAIDDARPRLLYASVLPLTAACFYAYQAVAILPLLAFHALRKKQLGWREAGLLSVPLLLLAAWQLSGYLHRGTIYASTMYGYISTRGLLLGTVKFKIALATLTYLGGVVFVFPFALWKTAGKWKGLAGGAVCAALVMVLFRDLHTYTAMERAFVGVCFAAGVTVLVWIARRGLKSASGWNWRTDQVFLALWFFGSLSICVFGFFSASARYVLPALPPLILLAIGADDLRRQFSRVFYGSFVALQVLLGLALSISDYEFAETGRREAQDFRAKYLSESPRPRFLFSAEWGLRHYLQSMGGEMIVEDTVGRPGDLVVVSRLSLGRIFDNELGRSLEVVEKRTYTVRSPVRLLAEHSRAGFWSDGWGLAPFTFSRDPLDEFTVYRVKRKQTTQ